MELHLQHLAECLATVTFMEDHSDMRIQSKYKINYFCRSVFDIQYPEHVLCQSTSEDFILYRDWEK